MSEPYSHRLRADRLPLRRATEIDLVPDAAARARIAAMLDLLSLPQARLHGALTPFAAHAWQFEGQVEAEVVQPCGITLAPVTTRISEPLRRVWSPHADAGAASADEVEMGDDETEPLEAEIDLGRVLVEALSLALPPFPRAPGATLNTAEPEAPDSDTRRPFADLGAILKRDR